MKKSLLLLFFITGLAQAQIINFPDANFKAKLLEANPGNTVAYGGGVAIRIDDNSDGEIQVSEALIVEELNIMFSGIVDLTGISSFSNLKNLYCSNNDITSLDVTSLNALTHLSCYDNLLTSINVVGLNNLQTLSCFNNQLGVLNVSGLNNLIELDFNTNQITSIDLTGLSNLTYLNCGDNQITSLALSNLINLEMLACHSNLLTSLDISSNPLISLGCDDNQLNTLLLTGAVNLITFNCSNNQLTSLSFSGLSNLQAMNCGYNQLTSLDFAGLLNLSDVGCEFNQLTSLDFSGNPLLWRLNCVNNDLSALIIKNGAVQDIGKSYWDNNPNLSFVCIDENEFNEVQTIIDESLLTNVNFNSYCSFTPGGSYNTITGTIVFDADNDGCDMNDIPQPFIKLNMNDGTSYASTFDNNNGTYNFYTLDGNFTLTPDVENPTWFISSPANATVNFPIVDNSVFTQNFCITANGVRPDVEIVLAPIQRAIPGNDATYLIVYKNKGNQILSGDVNFTYDDAVLDFVSATVTQDSQSTGSLSWNYSNLLPFENRAIYVTLNVNTPTDTPPVNIDDVLVFTAIVNPITGDEIPVDNVFDFHQTVVGAYDPNEKICMEGNVVSPSQIGNYLHYIIHFENTGTAEAENIVVKDVIDETMFDIKTLQIMNSSHGVEAKVTGNIVEFIFKGIKLPAGGHGNILLKIKTKSDLEVGDVVSNKAEIFFDYNYPIDTNVANTQFQSLSTNGYTIDQSVSIYPNPSKGNVLVKANGNIKSVQLFDIQGRILETRTINEQQLNMDISKYSNGVYFLKVLTDVGIKTEKLIKN